MFNVIELDDHVAANVKIALLALVDIMQSSADTLWKANDATGYNGAKQLLDACKRTCAAYSESLSPEIGDLVERTYLDGKLHMYTLENIRGE